MSIKIQFATDFVCPYCFAAELPLQQALEGRDNIEIELLPIELTEISKEPVDTYHDEARKAKWAKDLVPFCEKIGLEGHFPPKVIPRPYTHLAWQGYHYANALGKGIPYAEAMYRAYFVDEKNIGDIDVLCEIAETLGMDSVDFRSTLELETYSEFQTKAVAQTRSMGVEGVPTIWMNGIRLNGDMYTKEIFDYFLDLAESGENGAFAGGFGCGADGC